MTDADTKRRWARWFQSQLDIKGWSVQDFLDRSAGQFGKNAPYRWLNADNVPTSPARIRGVAKIFGVDPREAFDAAGMSEASDKTGDIVVASDPAEAFIQRIRARGFPSPIEKRLIDEIRREIAQREAALEATLDTVAAAVGDSRAKA